MKSLRDYSLNITEEEYHSLPCWHHSAISTYADQGFSSIATLHVKREPTPSMRFGSLLDSMLTKGASTKDEYVVLDTLPSPAEKNVLECLAKEFKVPFVNVSVDDVIRVMNDCEYQIRLKDQTRYEKVAAQSKYYDILVSGKKIVSSDEWSDAAQMYKIFHEDPYLKTLFGIKNTPDVEYLYQIKFKSTFVLEDGTSADVCVMFDLLKVDHKEKTIQPVDLKTSQMPAFDFWTNFIKYRYDIQGAMYTDVLYDVINSQAPEYTDYKILPFLFTDISRSDMQPVTWEYDPCAPDQINGLCYESNGKTYQYKDWQTLLGEIIYYENAQAKVPFGIKTDGPNKLLDMVKGGRKMKVLETVNSDSDQFDE